MIWSQTAMIWLRNYHDLAKRARSVSGSKAGPLFRFRHDLIHGENATRSQRRRAAPGANSRQIFATAPHVVFHGSSISPRRMYSRRTPPPGPHMQEAIFRPARTARSLKRPRPQLGGADTRWRSYSQKPIGQVSRRLERYLLWVDTIAKCVWFR